MKNACLIVVFILSFASLGHAQFSKVKYNLETPFTGLFTAERLKCDSIKSKTEGRSPNSSLTVYKRSKDGLRDTVFSHSGASRIDEYVYSPEGRLVESRELYPARSNATGTVYQYDEEGRIAAIVYNNGGSTIYDYSQNTIINRNNKDGTYKMTKVVYNDSGYLCQTTEYQTVNLSGKDTTILKYDTIEYVFDSENRLIRRSGTVFEYNDNGYCSYNYWNKEEFIFENEFEPKKIIYYQLIGNEWKVYGTTNFSYYYDNKMTNANGIPVLINLSKVYGAAGLVVVELEQPAQINIYSINGQLMKRQRLESGRSYVPMVPGIYIAQINNDVFKLNVK